MTTRLVACVEVPQLLVQLARQGAAVLRARPLIVTASTSDRGLVLDRCARAAAGIRVGMPVLLARRCCRDLMVVPRDRALLAEAATRIARVLAAFGDAIQPAARDRWILELTALGCDFRAALPLAHEVHSVVTATTGLECVVGLGPGPLVARIAAQLAVAPGVMVVLPGTEATFLADLPVALLPGVGAQTRQQLARFGVTRIRQLREMPVAVLEIERLQWQTVV